MTKIVELIFAIALAVSPVDSSLSIQTDGDLIFGGLFPMHEKGSNGKRCGSIKKEKGIQRVEAMMYAVDMINNDEELLPNITIGVHILDTCSFATYALEQSMDFIKVQLTSIDSTEYTCLDKSQPKLRSVKPVAGVIGAASSTVSIMVANILRLFKIPQISYASTGTELSDKTRFEYFSRVVPPDSKQAKAMVDICKKFGWTYVITLADEGSYGEKGIATFKEEARKKDICVAESLEIPRRTNRKTWDRLLNDLIKVEKAVVVVMFINEDNARKFLSTIEAKNVKGDLTFLASDSWGAKTYPVDKQEEAALGAVTLLPKRRVVPGFDEYFLNLTFNNHKMNPWFREYVESSFNCSFRDDLHIIRCNGDEAVSQMNHRQEGLVQFVIDSVYALAHAVHNLFQRRCPYSDYKKCAQIMPVIAGPDLLAAIRNVSFIGVSGDKVHFDGVGDGLGSYDVFQFQKVAHEKYGYVRIGDWNKTLTLNDSLLTWRQSDIPRSVCSEPCPFGYIKNAREKTCCWFCTKCSHTQILLNESACGTCPNYTIPDKYKRTCIQMETMSLKWNSIWTLIPVIFSSLGICCTVFVFLVFLKYNTTPVVMASGRELCYILLAGIFLSYLLTFVILARPTIVLCTIKRLFLGMSLSFIYAALLTKTNRIYRIFHRGVKAMVKRPSYTSPKSQIIICFGMVSVQVIGSLTWLAFERPDTIQVRQQKDILVLKCKTTQLAVIVSLSYNILLIIFCTTYAFKTRNIPQNFNEAKYIAFTMYSTCIVWLAFVSIYFGANNNFKVELTSMSMCVSISATVALVCLFASKMYIVLFQPHKNVRQVSTSCTDNAVPTSQRQGIMKPSNKVETSMTYNGSFFSSDAPRNLDATNNDSCLESSGDEGCVLSK